MAAVLKKKLKAARDALGEKDFEAAKAAALQVLDYEPGNYNANVFLGLACLELGDHERSEQAYRKAIDLNPEQVLAWQGISKFYERTGKWDRFADTLRHLLDMYAKSDPIKCAETLQKLLSLHRSSGTRTQLIQTLSLLLPSSPLHPILTGLPPLDPTNPSAMSAIVVVQEAMVDSLKVLEEIVLLTETEEAERFKREFEKRRLRLDASGPEQIKKAVGREIWATSQLPNLYNEVLNHPNTPDDLRRATESKLLRHKQAYLHALPAGATKAKVASEVDEMVNGALLLGIADELAWMIYLEGKDCDTIVILDAEGYDLSILRRAISLFPSLPLTALLKAYFAYMDIPLSPDEDDEGQDASTHEDAFDTIIDTFSSTSDFVLANRIVAEIYLKELDYENAIKVAESGLELVRRAEIDTSKKINQVSKAFNVILATSYVHLYPPKHHRRALLILDEVLFKDPSNIACLMSRAYVLQHAQNWAEASALFARVVDEDEDDCLRAKEEEMWCAIKMGEFERALQGLEEVLGVLEGLEGREADKARCLWRIGTAYWDMGGPHREESYRYFVSSLKCDSTYAAAFTSLGYYYLSHASPPDPTRASKCFQKAFELDAREADAAKRLAEGFGEDGEWDLVEIVARRTIEGEGGLEAGLGGGGDGASVGTTRFLPTNAWAWKAVGVVELMRRNYAPAIQAFQVALRADPDDQLSWVRLGEAYSCTGRHAAALKALARAHELDPTDWMCTYFIGEVQRQTGQFTEAIASFEHILVARPGELGPLVALAQTILELGRMERVTGFVARAEESFVKCVEVALRAMQEGPGFRSVALKIAADAIFALSQRSPFVDEGNVRASLARIRELLPSTPSERLAGIIPLLDLNLETTLTGVHALEIAAVAYDYRLSLGSRSSSGSSWFDLGMAIHIYSTKSPSSKAKAQKQAIVCVVEALREDAGNDAYWVALGSMYFAERPKTAQHAFIKALEIDNKNAATWTHLGLLCLHHDDFELASEALNRAQILDPDFTLAWVGQGLVASANGHHTDAANLFEHAVSLSVSVPEGDLEFASRAFAGLSSPASSTDVLLFIFSVLDRCCQRLSTDASALHLFALICERLEKLDYAVHLIQRAISILEAAYEDTEDPVVEWQFTIANSNLGRILLARSEFDEAFKTFENVIALVGERDDKTAQILRVQGLWGSALAMVKMGDTEESLKFFQEALGSPCEEGIRGQVTVMLAKTLWVLGSEEGMESAKAQLLECITNDPGNLAAITVLAGMGILTNDEGLVDATLSELLSLPTEKRQERDPGREVDYLMSRYYLSQGNPDKAMTALADPSIRSTRTLLALLLLQRGDPAGASAVLPPTTPNAEREEGPVRAVAVTRMNGLGVRQAQRAVLLAPWEASTWGALAFACCEESNDQ